MPVNQNRNEFLIKWNLFKFIEYLVDAFNMATLNNIC